MIRSLAVLLPAGAILAVATATAAWPQTAPAGGAHGASKSATAPVAVEEPRDIVAALYRLAAGDAKKARPVSPYRDPKARAAYFSKTFDLLVATSETKAAHDGEPAVDFDPISASPDAELQKVTLKTDLLELGKAVVSATFLNHGVPTVVTYDFVKDEGDWKINDIKGTTEKEAWSVRKILQARGKAPTALPGMPNAGAPADATLPSKDAPLPPKKDSAAQ